MVGEEKLLEKGVEFPEEINFANIKFYYTESLQIIFVEKVHPEMRSAVLKVLICLLYKKVLHFTDKTIFRREI